MGYYAHKYFSKLIILIQIVALLKYILQFKLPFTGALSLPL